MSLSTLQEKFLPRIETALQEFINTQDFVGDDGLRKMIIYHMGWPDAEAKSTGHGKRLRPLLLLLCIGALNEDSQKSLPAAVAVELLHNFTLVHDDIEDQSPFRHGKPTVWKKWGIAQAINTGDALFSLAQISMLDLRKTSTDEIAAESACQLNRTCLQLIQGQHLDLSFEQAETISIDTYLEMIRGKTAALISLSTRLSGVISDQDKDIQQHLAEFGESLGMAFQIQDDGLGVWGDPTITGKSAASDIKTGKKTLPIIYGLEHSPEFQKMWEKEGLDTEQISQMAEILEDSGAKSYIKSKTEAYTEKALSNLERLFLKKNDEAEALIELSQKLLNRSF